jgi:hypothetical protein
LPRFQSIPRSTWNIDFFCCSLASKNISILLHRLAFRFLYFFLLLTSPSLYRQYVDFTVASHLLHFSRWSLRIPYHPLSPSPRVISVGIWDWGNHPNTFPSQHWNLYQTGYCFLPFLLFCSLISSAFILPSPEQGSSAELHSDTEWYTQLMNMAFGGTIVWAERLLISVKSSSKEM